MIRKPRKTAGLIGLGIIGSRAAAGLRAAGFQTFVWNRTPLPAPNFLPDPGEVAAATDIIQIFVADATALFDVLEALKGKLTPQHVIVCSATVGPEATIEASRFVHETGARFLDAPFTGSKVAAERRQLVYYVGGEESVFVRAKPLLEATSKTILRMGGIGDAAIVKVVTNMIAAVSIQALVEAFAIVRKAGISDEAFTSALENNACRSGTMELKLPKMISGDYEPHFSLKHMFKDVQLGIQMANTLDLDCPAASVTAGAMFGGIKQGWGDLDFASIFKVYDKALAGTRALAAPPEAAPPSASAELPGPVSAAEAPAAGFASPAELAPAEEGGAPTPVSEAENPSPPPPAEDEPPSDESNTKG